MTQPHARRTYQVPASRSVRSSTAQPARSTYRQLISRGFDAGEASNLTAFINGLPIDAQPWTITGISHLLFLRELYRTGRFGWTDGDSR
jgi:hypothetical protein